VRQAVLRTGATALVGFAVLAGCGDQQAGGPTVSSSSTSSGSATATPAEGALTVVLDDGNGTQQTWELACSAEGEITGDHPDAQNACAAIEAAKDPWAPVPKDMACTMIYGGPQTATVKGSWKGVEVDASYNRTDGCEISRWERVAPLLQPGTPVGGSKSAL